MFTQIDRVCDLLVSTTYVNHQLTRLHYYHNKLIHANEELAALSSIFKSLDGKEDATLQKKSLETIVSEQKNQIEEVSNG